MSETQLMPAQPGQTLVTFRRSDRDRPWVKRLPIIAWSLVLNTGRSGFWVKPITPEGYPLVLDDEWLLLEFDGGKLALLEDMGSRVFDDLDEAIRTWKEDREGTPETST